MHTRRHLLRGLTSLAVSSLAWPMVADSAFSLPTESLFLDGAVPAWVNQVAEHHLRAWESNDQRELSLAGASNAEWDFMGRTFLVLGLANLCLRQPAQQQRYIQVMDAAIEDTLVTEASKGFAHFLMAYGQFGGWTYQPSASVFVDGEIALMLAARLMIADNPDMRRQLRRRLEKVAAQMQAGPRLSGESYPDECWTFCNTTALAALELGGALGVHVAPDLPRRWLQFARNHLVEPSTGLLVSSYHLDGRQMDGPEGSSLWMSAHNLLLVNPEFARNQYRIARNHLQRDLLGFGYAKEWPDHLRGAVDVDSGPEVPFLRASPGSSGMALIAAKAFGDRQQFAHLVSALQLAAFPEVEHGTRRYRASNAVGDAVLLYAATLGPLWKLAQRRRS